MNKNKINSGFKRVSALVLCAVILASSAACNINNQNGSSSGNSSPSTETQLSFEKYCDSLFKESLEDDAYSAHMKITNPSDYGLKYDKDDYTFGEISDDYFNDYYKDLKKEQKNLKKFDREKLTSNQKLTYDTLSDYFDISLSSEGTQMLQNIFAPQSGTVPNMFMSLSEFVFYEKDDIDLYLALLKDSKRYYDECISFAKKQAEDGYFMTEEIAKQSIEECEKHIKNDTDVLVDEFESRISKLKLSDSEKKNAVDTNREYCKKYYIPALKKVKKALENLKKSGKNDGGLCGFGEIGKKYYESIVRDNTSSNMTPKEVIEYLENSYSSLMTSMAFGVNQSDYTNFQSYKPDFKSADEIVQFLIENIDNDFPDAVTDTYTVSYMSDASKSDNVGAYYMLGRIDDTSVNIIRVNPDSAKDDTTQLYTNLSHESYPGHLYQYTNFNANKDIPNVRKLLSFIGSTEGWAQYASKCALDYLDTTDGVKKLIYVNELLGYIIYSRIDAGVNYEGWDYDDVSKYVSQNLGSSGDELKSICDEAYNLARSNPGYFLPYTIGYLKMIDMRQKAEKQLGSSFDAKEYHQFIMNLGITSIDVYEKALGQWLESKR